jgi:uncharacterized protein
MPSIETSRSWYPAADPVHGFDHVLRVYALAERIARAEQADLEIVRAAVLLHDAVPPREENQALTGDLAETGWPSHHLDSAAFARQVLAAEGWPEDRQAAVEHCIRAHRFRDESTRPATLEARVLFDADKLDAIGAVGVARAIAYAAGAGQPFYAPASHSFLQTGQREVGEPHSAYHEFLFKLCKLRDRLYTASARKLAEDRHQVMEAYFLRLQAEARGEV